MSPMKINIVKTSLHILTTWCKLNKDQIHKLLPLF